MIRPPWARTGQAYRLPGHTAIQLPSGFAYSRTMRILHESQNLLRSSGVALLGAAGIAAGIGFGAVAVLRRNRPIHSVGAVVSGRLTIESPARIGSPVFDAAGDTPLVARLSRSASWPVELPDIMGLALRIPAGGSDGGPADLLFASTGTGKFTRYVLQLRSTVSNAALTTMLPLASPAGNIVFRLDPEQENHYRLCYSQSSQPWLPLGRVSLTPLGEPLQRSNTADGLDDAGLRFRPVAHPPAGLTVPRWIAAVRAPAYRFARAAWHP